MAGIWPLNNVPTQDGYVDAVTAQFPRGRTSFSLQVYNAGAYYKLIRYRPDGGGQYYPDETEHFVAPVLAGFDDPEKEGLSAGELFGGIMFRSAVLGTPAFVTVI